MRIRRLLLPVFLEILFIIATLVWPRYALYAYLVFYAGVIALFGKGFSFSIWMKQFAAGKRFIVPVLYTAVGMGAAHGVRMLLIRMLSAASGGVKEIWTNGLFEILIYAVVMIVMMPVAEGLFFRRACTNLKQLPYLTSMLGVLLCALAHGTGWLGILEGAVLAVPLAVSYVRSHNFYVPFTVHLIYCIYEYLPYVGYVIARMWLS